MLIEIHIFIYLINKSSLLWSSVVSVIYQHISHLPCPGLIRPPHLSTLLHILGEALLVSSGLILYFGDMLAHTLSKVWFICSRKKRYDLFYQLVVKMIIYLLNYFALHLWWQMEFSVSSKAFIRTPGTRSDMTTIIQVELLLIVWHDFHWTFMLTCFHFGRGFYLAFFYFHYYTRVLFKFGIHVEWRESNKHKQLRNIREKELVLLYSISHCWWC